MNVAPRTPDNELDRAVRAVRDREIPAMPQLVVHFPSAESPRLQPPPSWNRRARRRVLATLSCAMLVAVAAFVSLYDRAGSTVAIAQVLNNTSSAVAVRFETQLEFGGSEDSEKRVAPLARSRLSCAIQQGKLRITAATGLTLVEEPATGRGVWTLARRRPPHDSNSVDYAAKVDPGDRSSKSPTRQADPLERLRRLRPDDAKFTGSETLDGQEVERWTWKSHDPEIWGRASEERSYGFRDEPYSIDVWVAKSDQLPRRITISSPSGDRLTYDRLVWNRPLAAEQFSLDIPAGYQEIPLERLQELAARIEPTQRP